MDKFELNVTGYMGHRIRIWWFLLLPWSCHHKLVAKMEIYLKNWEGRSSNYDSILQLYSLLTIKANSNLIVRSRIQQKLLHFSDEKISESFIKKSVKFIFGKISNISQKKSGGFCQKKVLNDFFGISISLIFHYQMPKLASSVNQILF